MYENPFYEPYWTSEEELEHFGVKGMKWGVRRYQNADGTLTEAGKKKLETYRRKEYNKVAKQSSAYETRVKNRRTKSKQKGLMSDPLKEKKANERISNYKKELKQIEKMKFSNMQAEKVAAGKQWLKYGGVAFGFGVIGVSVAAGTGLVKLPAKRVSDMRLEWYDQEQKKK